SSLAPVTDAPPVRGPLLDVGVDLDREHLRVEDVIEPLVAVRHLGVPALGGLPPPHPVPILGWTFGFGRWAEQGPERFRERLGSAIDLAHLSLPLGRPGTRRSPDPSCSSAACRNTCS